MVPITVIILILLFVFQRRGTAGIGIGVRTGDACMVLYTSCPWHIGHRRPASSSAAVSPDHAIHFFLNNHFRGFLVLGAVFLVVAGGEALYADMGHFNAKSIRLAWYGSVLPALVLNYFGQGAILLSNPQLSVHPFDQLAPGWALYPLVVLVTMATVIALQAVISGGIFVQPSGLVPGPVSATTRDTNVCYQDWSRSNVPTMNWLLMAGTIALVLGFRTSSGLAEVYGVAVSTTMVITTLLAFRVTRETVGVEYDAGGSRYRCIPGC